MLGCNIFEKHYTSFKEWEGPDIEISITPKELRKLIEDLDILKKCMINHGRSKIQDEEQGTIDFAFNTLTTNKNLNKGHILKEEDLIAKRPNIGDFLAKDIKDLIGKKINKDLKTDSKLFKTDLE